MTGDAMTTGAGQAYATATCDPLGDSGGFIQCGDSSIHDDVVSLRWLHSRLAQLAAGATEGLAEDDTIGTAFAVGQMQFGVALHAAWIALSRSGRARAGDLIDVAFLFVSGRGPVEALAKAAARGDFRDAARDENENLIIDQLMGSAGSGDSDTFTVIDAADILERSLRSYARFLEARLPGDDAFEWFASAVKKTRSTLTGAVAWLALARGGRQVAAQDLGDVMEIHAARGGSVSKIAADVLAGAYRDHPRDGDGELMFDGRSRARERRAEAWIAQERWLAGARKPRPPVSPG
jgi:hypothetical protein